MNNPPDVVPELSPSPVEVSWQELIDFAVGEATEEVAQRVQEALGDPQHPLYYLTQRGARTQALPANTDQEKSSQ